MLGFFPGRKERHVSSKIASPPVIGRHGRKGEPPTVVARRYLTRHRIGTRRPWHFTSGARHARLITPLLQTASKPNIVFLLMDNLGFGEPGCYGGGIVRGAPT